MCKNATTWALSREEDEKSTNSGWKDEKSKNDQSNQERKINQWIHDKLTI